MTACTYLTKADGSALVCPESSPDSSRCHICLLLILLDRGLYVPKHKPITAKLPA